MLNSTGLSVRMGDEPWQQVREAHFARARELVERGQGHLIKTIGDSVMTAFHSASDALDFALALHKNTGHEAVSIRAGIWVSAKVKEDVDILRSSKHQHLKWTERPDQELKGFPEKCTLWSVEE